jgi:hypothetical protein
VPEVHEDEIDVTPGEVTGEIIKNIVESRDDVERGVFALRLAVGITRTEESLRQYVVTPRDCPLR